MSFWGPDTTQRNAQSALGQIPAQVLQWAQQGNTQALQAWAKANNLSDDYLQNLEGQMAAGFGTPDQVRGVGQQVMPGVDNLTNTMDNRVQGEVDNYNNLPGVDQTIGTIDDALNNKGQRIGQNYQDIQGAIDNGFGQQRSRNATSADTLGNNITGTYGGAQDAAAKAFGGAQSNAATGFGKIGANATNTYNAVRSRINQGRDFANGTTARAFAPEMASALQSIRAAGIDPNSPQAQSLIQSVNTNRGRAYDDSMQSTLAQLNQADLGQQQNQQGLDLSQLSNDQMLALQKAANAQGLTLQQYADQQGLTRETRNQANTLDQNNMVANVNNANAAFQQGQDFWDQQANNAVTDRNLNLQDQANRNQLTDKQNSQDLIDQNLRNQQFQAGANFQGLDLQRRDAANTQLGNFANNLFGVSATQQGLAYGGAGEADQGYQKSYNVEAPSAGWGRNLIGGALGGVANAFLPGSGGFISSGISGKPMSTGSSNPYGGGGFNPWGIFKSSGGFGPAGPPPPGTGGQY